MDSWCILPWIHVYAATNGKVFPCCVSDHSLPTGDLNKNTIAEIRNSPASKEIRANMIVGIPNKHCSWCIDSEKRGGFSKRISVNNTFAHLKDECLADTQKDGTISSSKIPTFDVRFNNLCNFKCRTCGPHASSSWFEDAKAIRIVSDNQTALTSVGADAKLVDQIVEHASEIERINFAGGEPFMMPEVYDALERLVGLGKTSAKVTFNTNLSVLKLKSRSIIELLKNFSDVGIAISIDGTGSRGEYIRKGMDWKSTLTNLEELKASLPHALLHVSCTVSAMNALHIPDMHQELVDTGLMDKNRFLFIPLNDPEEYHVGILPIELKDSLRQKYASHIEWIGEESAGAFNPARDFRHILEVASQDKSALVRRFLDRTQKLDLLRGESLGQVFPELLPLLHSS